MQDRRLDRRCRNGCLRRVVIDIARARGLHSSGNRRGKRRRQRGRFRISLRLNRAFPGFCSRFRDWCLRGLLRRFCCLQNRFRFLQRDFAGMLRQFCGLQNDLLYLEGGLDSLLRALFLVASACSGSCGGLRWLVETALSVAEQLLVFEGELQSAEEFPLVAEQVQALAEELRWHVGVGLRVAEQLP